MPGYIKKSSTAATVDPPGGRGSQDIQDVLPSEGGTEVVSSGGVPGGGSDEDGDAGALRAPAHTQHCGDAEEVNLPLPRFPWCDIDRSYYSSTPE